MLKRFLSNVERQDYFGCIFLSNPLTQTPLYLIVFSISFYPFSLPFSSLHLYLPLTTSNSFLDWQSALLLFSALSLYFSFALNLKVTFLRLMFPTLKIDV
ncbi:hypothetical protein RIF29_41186 [Crotalaria pallida]|uniref:Uncharacterized protein n=1 Tax=Crotalaria pallida TaxID=3830 RepID=A0AAN9EAS6_CROPI